MIASSVLRTVLFAVADAVTLGVRSALRDEVPAGFSVDLDGCMGVAAIVTARGAIAVGLGNRTVLLRVQMIMTAIMAEIVNNFMSVSIVFTC